MPNVLDWNPQAVVDKICIADTDVGPHVLQTYSICISNSLIKTYGSRFERICHIWRRYKYWYVENVREQELLT